MFIFYRGTCKIFVSSADSDMNPSVLQKSLIPAIGLGDVTWQCHISYSDLRPACCQLAWLYNQQSLGTFLIFKPLGKVVFSALGVLTVTGEERYPHVVWIVRKKALGVCYNTNEIWYFSGTDYNAETFIVRLGFRLESSSAWASFLMNLQQEPERCGRCPPHIFPARRALRVHDITKVHGII